LVLSIREGEIIRKTLIPTLYSCGWWAVDRHGTTAGGFNLWWFAATSGQPEFWA
jgi:hypothetical protein